MEIITIDDFSTDGSFEELKRLQAQYPMMVVMRNEQNCGVSHTRNVGLMAAKGKYVGFVDSDDYILVSEYRKMLQIIQKENACAICGKISTSGGGDEEKYDVYTAKTVYTPNHVAGGIYLLVFLKEKKICFNEKMTVGEDLLFNYEVAAQESARVIAYAGICYIVVESPVSLMRGKRSERKKIAVFESHYEMLKCFSKYKQNGVVDQGAIEFKFVQQTQNTVYTLMQVSNGRFVRKKLRELKQNGYYPYRQPGWLIPKNFSLLKRMALFMLPNPIGAYAFHLFWKLMRK